MTGSGAFRSIAPRAVVVAAGAVERVVPFPGWTLPGVIGLSAATVLLKSPGSLPVGPVVVAGRGPLLAAAAAGLLDRGAKLACVVDGATRADWARALPGMLSRPDLVAQGIRWLRRIRRAGVPILHGHEVVRALGQGAVEAVCIRPRSGRTVTVAAGLLAVGHGLVPATEVLAMFGAAMRHDAAERVWCPVLDRDGRTTVSGLYAAGDGAGIRGGAAAELGGRLAGLAAALDLGALSARDHAGCAGPLRRRFARTASAGRAMARLSAPTGRLLAGIPADTVVCRCEDVTRAEIDAVFAAGATDLHQLKARTRCGMGPCQGRVCAPTVAGLAALHPHVASPAQPWTVRPPLRAVTISELVGVFGYDEIPSVTPAI